MAVLMLCCVCAEAISADTDNYSMDRTKTEYAGDYQDFRDLKNELDDIEGNDTYRMELTSLRARMDPAWYNYNGVSTFSSMAYEKVAICRSSSVSTAIISTATPIIRRPRSTIQ